MAPVQLADGAEKPPDLPQINIALRQGLQGSVIVTLAPETVTPTVQVWHRQQGNAFNRVEPEL